MKKAIAIAAFIAIALVSVNVMAQEPVGPRNITVTTTPEGGYNVTRFGRDLLPGWLVLISNPETRRHDVAVVTDLEVEVCEDVCETHRVMVLINDGATEYIVDTDRYLVAAADSMVRVVNP